jgi:hypothetical protein
MWHRVPYHYIGYFNYDLGYAYIGLKDSFVIKNEEISLKEIVRQEHIKFLQHYPSYLFYVKYTENIEDEFEDEEFENEKNDEKYMVLNFCDLLTILSIYRKEICKYTFGKPIKILETLVYDRNQRMYDVSNGITKDLLPIKMTRKKILEYFIEKCKTKGINYNKVYYKN